MTFALCILIALTLGFFAGCWFRNRSAVRMYAALQAKYEAAFKHYEEEKAKVARLEHELKQKGWMSEDELETWVKQ